MLAYFWAPWAPQGPQNGPRDPGDRFKIEKKIDFFKKIGPEVSTIFEILIFGFWGVFQWKIDFSDFSVFLPLGGPWAQGLYKKSMKFLGISIWNSLSPVGANCKSHFCFPYFINVPAFLDHIL